MIGAADLGTELGKKKLLGMTMCVFTLDRYAISGINDGS
jgi:hypothetical protein